MCVRGECVRQNTRVDGWVDDEWMDGWMVGWMTEEWMCGWTGGWVDLELSRENQQQAESSQSFFHVTPLGNTVESSRLLGCLLWKHNKLKRKEQRASSETCLGVPAFLAQ